jgi:hypothetical protein
MSERSLRSAPAQVESSAYPVAHRGLDLPAIANEIRILCELLNFVEPNIVPFSGDQPIESPPITFPLLQDNRPTQPGLCTFDHQKLKLLAVVAIAIRTKSIILEFMQNVTLRESCHFDVLGLQVAVAAQPS